MIYYVTSFIAGSLVLIPLGFLFSAIQKKSWQKRANRMASYASDNSLVSKSSTK